MTGVNAGSADTVPTKILTVKSIRIVVCQAGNWVETGQTNRVDGFTDGSPFMVRERSKDEKLTALMMAKARAEVVGL